MSQTRFHSLRTLGWTGDDAPRRDADPLCPHTVGPRNTDDPAMAFTATGNLLAAGEEVLIFQHDPRVCLDSMV